MRRILIIVALTLFSCDSASAQIYRVAEMNTEQIRALDRQKTVVLLPGGVLEAPMNAGEICVLPIVYPDSFCSIS